jgi:hypothetical protein
MFITYGVIRISMLHLYQGTFWTCFQQKAEHICTFTLVSTYHVIVDYQKCVSNTK